MRGDVFYFDYGVLALWGLTERAEREVVRGLAGPCLVDALPAGEVEVDEFSYHYTLSEKPHIQNDTFTSEAGVVSAGLDWTAAGGDWCCSI